MNYALLHDRIAPMKLVSKCPSLYKVIPPCAQALGLSIASQANLPNWKYPSISHSARDTYLAYILVTNYHSTHTKNPPCCWWVRYRKSMQGQNMLGRIHSTKWAFVFRSGCTSPNGRVLMDSNARLKNMVDIFTKPTPSCSLSYPLSNKLNSTSLASLLLKLPHLPALRIFQPTHTASSLCRLENK